MENTTRYNLDKLTKVELSNFKESYFFYLKNKPKKYFWQKEQKEGFYYECLGLNYLGSELPEYHILIDGIVYQKPQVCLYFENDFGFVKNFDNLKDAETYFIELTKDRKWLQY